MHDTWDLIDAKLGAYVRGQLVLIVFGPMLSAIFYFIGPPFWLLLGIFAGVVEIIPVIGPLTAGVVAIGVGLTESWQVALAAGIAVLVVRLVEDYVDPESPGGRRRAHAAHGARRRRGDRVPLRRVRRPARDPARRGARDPGRRPHPPPRPGPEDVPTVLFPAKDAEAGER